MIYCMTKILASVWNMGEMRQIMELEAQVRVGEKQIMLDWIRFTAVEMQIHAVISDTPAL